MSNSSIINLNTHQEKNTRIYVGVCTYIYKLEQKLDVVPITSFFFFFF